jgi:hypothetical protein
MKYCLFVFVLAAACAIGACCEQAESIRQPQTSDEPAAELAMEKKVEAPLLLDDEPLLLLGDDGGSEQSDGPQADNSRCFVCHVNYMEEDIAVVHARANIGCAGCHGESDEHIADESWASGGNGTAPDTMFPKPKIVAFCMSCHTKDKIDLVQHRPLFANMDKIVCTDCHGKHRITTARKCKWK